MAGGGAAPAAAEPRAHRSGAGARRGGETFLQGRRYQQPGIALFGIAGRSCRAATSRLTAEESAGNQRSVTAGPCAQQRGGSLRRPGRWVTRGWARCGAGLGAGLDSMRDWAGCGAGLSAVLGSVRGWARCGAGHSAGLVSVRGWARCGAGHSAGLGSARSGLPGYFAGAAKRSKAQRSKLQAERGRTVSNCRLRRAGRAAEPGPAGPRVPAAPNYKAGPGGTALPSAEGRARPGRRQKRHRNGRGVLAPGATRPHSPASSGEPGTRTETTDRV